jgi:hypothetical protein
VPVRAVGVLRDGAAVRQVVRDAPRATSSDGG